MNKRNSVLAAMALGIAGVALSARAAPLLVFSTGVDASQNMLPDATIGDPHYSLVSVPLGTTTTRIRRQAGGYPLDVWLGDDSTSTWIGPDNNGGILPPSASGQLYGPVGLFDYQTTFTLPSDGTVNIVGQWATDNFGTDILLDGMSDAAGQLATTFDAWTPFSITGAAYAGTNTLDFLVDNTDTGLYRDQQLPGPTGLRVEIFSATVVAPEPGSLVILVLGLNALLRRQKRTLPTI